ncbi:isopentenyl-diphosphate Delta-isomerase [Actinopolyspora saharensis]|uniref:isopentenyl-diphosphate Delta-isomerase n=1 Tax=Actinopolyspora saharensis TaxID=995062 RepID=UPI003F680FCB
MEEVVLLDESGRATGVADKATVHHEHTPLHLAFSCYVIDGDNQLLLTRRAASKTTWPGVWTNSCCGHPAPGEALTTAVTRRLHEELGLAVEAVELILPTFRYRAVMDNGTVENEMCPVLRARTRAVPHPDPTEVEAFQWTPWDEFAETAATDELAELSPWCLQQVHQLRALGPDARRWPAAPDSELPAAARNATTQAW